LPAEPTTLTWRHHVSLLLLLSVAALSYIDRQIFTLFQDDIKAELALSDSQLGLITGLSFALFYSVMSFPIARYADRGDRRLVISASVVVWSMATALCGLAHGFWTMVMARVGLAAGEAGAGPAINSLLVEIYPPQRRTLVLSSVLAASSVGLSGGLALGGWLSHWYDWRTVFLIVGLPGVALGLLVWMITPEPRRAHGAAALKEQIPLRDVVRTITGNPSLRWVALLLATVPVTGFALILWGPSFFQRVHHMDKAQTGFWLGGAMLVGLVIGNLLAGWLGDRFGSKDPRFNGKLAGWGLLLAFPFALAFAWTANPWIALACFIVVKFMMTLHLGPIIALSFSQVPTRMRATLSATISMMIGLAGTGVGGTLAGVLSQAYGPAWGEMSLRPALATLSCCLVVGAFAAFMAGRTAKPIEE